MRCVRADVRTPAPIVINFPPPPPPRPRRASRGPSASPDSFPRRSSDRAESSEGDHYHFNDEDDAHSPIRSPVTPHGHAPDVLATAAFCIGVDQNRYSGLSPTAVRRSAARSSAGAGASGSRPSTSTSASTTTSSASASASSSSSSTPAHATRLASPHSSPSPVPHPNPNPNPHSHSNPSTDPDAALWVAAGFPRGTPFDPARNPLPNKTARLDPRTVNLLLALKVGEVLACAEPMWDWVVDFQEAAVGRAGVGVGGGAASRGMGAMGRRRSMARRHPRQNALLALTRLEFDGLMKRFEL